MAGLAALMTRKKRDRRRELELKQQMQESFGEVTSKEAAALAAKKAASESVKKLILGQEIQKQHRLKQQGQSQDAVSQISYEHEDGPFASSGSAYNAIYLGLVFICIGVVITFVGLGEKGFKTLELKMIGPSLCVIGLACITIKIIHCSFPNVFRTPACLKKAKLRDSDQSNLMEKGVQNGHFGKKANSPKVLSPRVKLQSSKKAPRPTSTIPNYIGNEDSSDDDDFDPGRTRPHSNRYYNNAFEHSPKHSSSPSSTNTPKGGMTPTSTTPVTVMKPSSESQQTQQQARQQQGQQPLQQPAQSQQSARTQPPSQSAQQPQNELILSPQGLIL